MGFRDWQFSVVLLHLLSVNAVQPKNLRVTQTIDTRERKQFVDAGQRCFFVFDLRQPWTRNEKFFIAFGIGNGFAEDCNFARGNP